MNDDTERWLDGELDLEDVIEPHRAEAASWSRMLNAFRTEHPTVPAPAWLEDRVMAEIEALPEPGLLGRAWAWLLRPQPLRVSPAVLGMAAAAIVVVLLLPAVDRPAPGVAGSSGATGGGATETVVYVQFNLQAPGARSVSVGGDFDAWKGSFTLEDPDGDGVWTGRVPVRPGVHEYMFLVDGARWVTDPEAGRYSDDGFGNRNAVLAVAAPST
jgi:hypothetical protein